MPRLDTDIKLDFKDVLIRPKRSTLRSRSQVEIKRTYLFLNAKCSWTGVPILASNMDTVGTFKMAIELAKFECITCIHKHYSIEEWDEFAKENEDVLPFVAIGTGTGQADLDRIQIILEKYPKIQFICLDIANGYSEHFINVVKSVRQSHPNHILIAGNVVTGEMVEELLLSGADIIKIGIGPGSVCTTRKQTGVGYPQLSAVLECADAAHGLDGHVIADGGCVCPGDVAKAFGAGADFVMLGGMLAGHDESGGEIITKNGKKYKEFYGMSSSAAMEKHSGGVATYRCAEGKKVSVPYRGPIYNTIQDIMGGLRSACTYVGASKLKELSKRTTFIRCTQQMNEIFGKASNEQEDKHSKE